MRFPAARLTDMHTCPMCMGVPAPIVWKCAYTVLTGTMPQARVGDLCLCAGPPPPAGGDPIITGAWNVLVEGSPAARMTDLTAKAGTIITGFPTVLIGMEGGGATGGSNGAGPGAGPAFRNPTFPQKFKNITGLSVKESIDLYKANTGQDVSPQTIETLFTDATKAKEILSADKSLHTQFRDILNSNIPSNEAAAQKAGFTKLPWHKSMFHNPNYGLNPFQENNSKYVSADGHLEAVYDPDGNLVSDNKYKGTFNFFGPDKAGEHWDADIVPYGIWGN